jgi:peptidyl-prolyl cis-trans isomerase B (cyclophilin B)
VPTNEQRRANAKRKLDRKLERHKKQARRRRIVVIAGASIVVVAAIVAVVIAVVNTKHENKSATAATSSTAASSSPDTTTPAGPTPSAPPTGKIPTTPAQQSASMVTSQGNIGLLLANNESPCTVNSFASLTGQKYFNDTKCHRLTTSPGLGVLQCGDPKGDGTGGPGYGFGNEYPTDQYPPNDPKLQEPVVYPRGTLAMANSGQPNSNGSQFFMVYKDSQLPPQYTVFGTIQADGLATLDKIAKAGVAGGGDDGPPAVDVTIKSLLLD